MSSIPDNKKLRLLLDEVVESSKSYSQSTSGRDWIEAYFSVALDRDQINRQPPDIYQFVKGFRSYIQLFSDTENKISFSSEIEDHYWVLLADLKVVMVNNYEEQFIKYLFLTLLSFALRDEKVDYNFRVALRAGKNSNLLSKSSYYQALINFLSNTIFINSIEEPIEKIDDVLILLSIHHDKCFSPSYQTNDSDLPLCPLYNYNKITTEKTIFTSDLSFFSKKEDIITYINQQSPQLVILVGHGNDQSNEGLRLIINGSKTPTYFTPADAKLISHKHCLIILGCTYELFLKNEIHKLFKYFIGGFNITHRLIEIFMKGFLNYYILDRNIERAFAMAELMLIAYTTEDKGIELFRDGEKIRQ